MNWTRRAVRKFLTAIFVAFLAVAPCSAMGEEISPRLPDRSEHLQDGDVILTLSRSIVSSLMQVGGRPSGPFAHADVYVVTPEGGKIVTFTDEGLSIKTPEEFSKNSYLRAVVLRLKQPAQPGRLARALEILKKRNLQFDYKMRWPATDSTSTYCAGAISQLFRLAELPDPFPLSSAGKAGPWDDRIKKLFDIDLTQTVSANAPLYLPDFYVVDDYRNNSTDAIHDFAIFQALIEKAGSYMFDQKLNPKACGFGDKILLGLAEMGITLEDIPIDKVSPKQRESVLATYEFALAVTKRVKRTLYLNQDREWTERDIAELTAAVADGYRDDYFLPDDSL